MQVRHYKLMARIKISFLGTGADAFSNTLSILVKCVIDNFYIW